MAQKLSVTITIGGKISSSLGSAFSSLNTRIGSQKNLLAGLKREWALAMKGSSKFKGDIDQLKKSIDKAGDSLRKMQNRAKLNAKLPGAFGKLGAGLKSGAVRGAAPVLAGGAAGGAVFGNMLKVTSSFEDMMAVQKTLEGGNAAKAKANFDWINEFGKKTPYEINQVADAFTRLKAYGIDPIEGDTLRILGDSAAATGKSLEQVSEALAEAMMGDNERLKEAFSIKAKTEKGRITYFWDENGKAMKKTVSASNTALMKDTILAINNRRYKGAMDEKSKTWSGMISNMKDAWSLFAYDIMQSGPLIELKKQLGGLLGLVSAMKESGELKKWATESGAEIVKTIQNITELAKGFYRVSSTLAELLGGWDKLAIVIAAISFAPLIASLISVGAALWTITAALLANPVGAVVAGVVALGAAMFLIIKHWEAISGYMEGMPRWQKFLIGLVSPVARIYYLFQSIKEYFPVIIEYISKAKAKLLELFSAISPYLNRIPAVFLGRKAFDLVGGAAGKLGEMGAGAAGKLGEMDFSAFDKISKFMEFGKGNTYMEGRARTAELTSQVMGRGNVSNSNVFHITVSAQGQTAEQIPGAIQKAVNAKAMFDFDGALVPAR